MPEFACKQCGAVFSVRQEIVDRYDNWTPSTCLNCRDTSTKAKPSAAKKAPKKRRSPSKTATQNLTLDHVLDQFSGGPDTGVFTDGSSIPNPGPGGWGAVYVLDGVVVDQAHGHDPNTTNNRMELLALIEGAALVPDGTPTVLYSDSNLCVQTVNDWAAGWERNGWKRKSGPIKNLDLVQRLYAVAKARPELVFKWIKAHDGSLWNEYADALSTAWNRAEL